MLLRCWHALVPFSIPLFRLPVILISMGYSRVLQEQWLCLRRYGFLSSFPSSGFWHSCLVSSRKIKKSGFYPVMSTDSCAFLFLVKDDEFNTTPNTIVLMNFL